MALVDTIPNWLLRADISEDLSSADIYALRNLEASIPNLAELNQTGDLDGAKAALEPTALRLYNEKIKPFLIRSVENVYKTRAKAQPFIASDGTPWARRLRTTSIFKSVIEMANMLGDTTVDLTDENDVPHTYTLQEASDIMLALGGELRALYDEKLNVVLAIKADTDGSAIADYNNYVSKYAPSVI